MLDFRLIFQVIVLVPTQPDDSNVEPTPRVVVTERRQNWEIALFGIHLFVSDCFIDLKGGNAYLRGPYPHFQTLYDTVGFQPLCSVSLKPVTSKEIVALFHLCVAVTDKGRHCDDNELPRCHQTVITMVTAALCCCQSFSLIIPQQIHSVVQVLRMCTRSPSSS